MWLTKSESPICEGNFLFDDAVICFYCAPLWKSKCKPDNFDHTIDEERKNSKSKEIDVFDWKPPTRTCSVSSQTPLSKFYRLLFCFVIEIFWCVMDLACKIVRWWRLIARKRKLLFLFFFPHPPALKFQLSSFFFDGKNGRFKKKS